MFFFFSHSVSLYKFHMLELYTYIYTDEAEMICSKYNIDHNDGKERIKLVYKKIEELKLKKKQGTNRTSVFLLLLLAWERRGQEVGKYTDGLSRLCADRSILLRILPFLRSEQLA